MRHEQRYNQSCALQFNLIGRAGAELIIEALKEGEGSALLSLSVLPPTSAFMDAKFVPLGNVIVGFADHWTGHHDRHVQRTQL
jgi:hypothetical protein